MRGVRVVEGADLERLCGVKLTEGSNPFLSAILSSNPYFMRLCHILNIKILSLGTNTRFFITIQHG